MSEKGWQLLLALLFFSSQKRRKGPSRSRMSCRENAYQFGHLSLWVPRNLQLRLAWIVGKFFLRSKEVQSLWCRMDHNTKILHPAYSLWSPDNELVVTSESVPLLEPSRLKLQKLVIMSPDDCSPTPVCFGPTGPLGISSTGAVPVGEWLGWGDH